MPAYGNRTDLNSPANRQTYGEKTKLARAQKAVPVAPSPAPPAPNVVRSVPGERGSFTRPTERPSEPITAGAPFGPGVGPEAAGIPQLRGDQPLEELKAIYRMFPNSDLADLIDSAARDGI